MCPSLCSPKEFNGTMLLVLELSLSGGTLTLLSPKNVRGRTGMGFYRSGMVPFGLSS